MNISVPRGNDFMLNEGGWLGETPKNSQNLHYGIFFLTPGLEAHSLTSFWTGGVEKWRREFFDAFLISR